MKVDVVKKGQEQQYRFCRFSKLINKDKKKRSGKVQQVNQKWKVLSHVKMSKTFLWLNGKNEEGISLSLGMKLEKVYFFSFSFLAHLTRKHANLFGSNFSSFYFVHRGQDLTLRVCTRRHKPHPFTYNSKCICPSLVNWKHFDKYIQKH